MISVLFHFFFFSPNLIFLDQLAYLYGILFLDRAASHHPVVDYFSKTANKQVHYFMLPECIKTSLHIWFW